MWDCHGLNVNLRVNYSGPQCGIQKDVTFQGRDPISNGCNFCSLENGPWMQDCKSHTLFNSSHTLLGPVLPGTREKTYSSIVDTSPRLWTYFTFMKDSMLNHQTFQVPKMEVLTYISCM